MDTIGNKYAELLMNVVMTGITYIESLEGNYLDQPNEGRKWTRKEILGHLIDSAYHNHLRIIQTISKRNMDYQGYDQDLCVDLNQYKIRANEEVVETFVIVQRQLANLIAGLSDSELKWEYDDHKLHLSLMQDFTEDTPGSLSVLIWDYIFHIEHHLAQIIPGYAPVCPKDYY